MHESYLIKTKIAEKACEIFEMNDFLNIYLKTILKSLKSIPLSGVTVFEASQNVFKMQARPSNPCLIKF